MYDSTVSISDQEALTRSTATEDNNIKAYIHHSSFGPFIKNGSIAHHHRRGGVRSSNQR